MSRSLGRVAAPALAALLVGCIAQHTLDVGYEEAKAARGPLSAIDPRRIRIDVTDRRPQPGEVVGYVLAGFPARGPIAAPRPVREIVRDAIAAELQRNHHVAVAAGPADRVLEVDVRELWLSIYQGTWTIRFSATAAIAMTVADGQTGRALLRRDYQGHAVERGQSRREGNWRLALNGAIERMMREVATDPQLVEALRGAVGGRR